MINYKNTKLLNINNLAAQLINIKKIKKTF